VTRPLPRVATLWAAALAVLFLIVAVPAAAEPKYPDLTGRVVDAANVLSPATEAQLSGKLQALEERTTRQLVVVTVPDLQDYAIEDYGVGLLRHWGIGQKGTNNGALFIVAPKDRKVRVEVGYGLEDVLTDALSSVILQRSVLPKFRSGDVEGGVVAGTDELIGQLTLDAPEAKARVSAAAQQPAKRGFSPDNLIPLIIVFFVIMSIFGAGGRRRRRGGALDWILPVLIASSSSRGSSWGGGGGSSWGGGGGGFSGGGGSGGGGGASGSW